MAAVQSQKIGHVTFFWNGNRAAAFDEELETYKEVTLSVCSAAYSRDTLKNSILHLWQLRWLQPIVIEMRAETPELCLLKLIIFNDP